jgi:hypothetical protein
MEQLPKDAKDAKKSNDGIYENLCVLCTFAVTY